MAIGFPQRPLVKAWSYSRLGTYQSCPLKFKLTAIDKLAEPKGPAMERGNVIHGLAEAYLKGDKKTLPKELKLQEGVFKDLRARIKKAPHLVEVEQMWGFTADWQLTRWDNWTGCWLRVKLDVAHVDELTNTVVITDWKTGKFRPDNLQDYIKQLGLYGLAALLKYEHLGPTLKVQPRLVYLDNPTIYQGDGKEPLTFGPKDVAKLKKLWEKEVKPLFNDRVFAPKPNRWCGWCHFRKDNGGPCQY